MQSRRAVSPVLAIVILMGIAVVGGGILSSTQNIFLQTALSEMEFKITGLKLEKDSEGGCYLFFSVYNSGSQLIQKADFKTTINSTDWTFNISEIGTGLEPGNSTKVFKTTEEIGKNICGNFTTSNTYSVSINGSSPTSTYNVIKAIQAKEVSRK